VRSYGQANGGGFANHHRLSDRPANPHHRALLRETRKCQPGQRARGQSNNARWDAMPCLLPRMTSTIKRRPPWHSASGFVRVFEDAGVPVPVPELEFQWVVPYCGCSPAGFNRPTTAVTQRSCSDPLGGYFYTSNTERPVTHHSRTESGYDKSNKDASNVAMTLLGLTINKPCILSSLPVLS